MLGKPSSVNPVLIWFSAGPCVLRFAVIEWTKHMSSASSARCGSRSEIILPDSPARLELVQRPDEVAVLALERDELLGPPGIGWPSLLIELGLVVARVEVADAPEQKMTSTRFALAGEVRRPRRERMLGRMAGRSGRRCLRRRHPRRADASAMPPASAACARNRRGQSRGRRRTGVGSVSDSSVGRCIGRPFQSGQEQELVGVEQRAAERRQAVLADQPIRRAESPRRRVAAGGPAESRAGPAPQRRRPPRGGAGRRRMSACCRTNGLLSRFSACKRRRGPRPLRLRSGRRRGSRTRRRSSPGAMRTLVGRSSAATRPGRTSAFGL